MVMLRSALVISHTPPMMCPLVFPDSIALKQGRVALPECARYSAKFGKRIGQLFGNAVSFQDLAHK